MEQNFNVNRSFNIFCDKLTSNNVGKDLIIESSYNSIDFCGNKLIFDGEVYFDRVICNNITISNISEISTKFLRVNSMTLPTEVKILYNSVNDGYIINTRVGINSGGIIGRSDAYFTYINVSGGDSSFNNSVYINNNLHVDGILTISNNLLISGNNFASIDNSFNIYKLALEQSFFSNKISTIDVSALKISISNELYVNKTANINDLTISGQLLNNLLRVPNIFTIDPSGYDNHSGILYINGDLIVKGATTSFSSSIVDICDRLIILASNLVNISDLSNNNAGLDISNIASLKYNGTLWNFSGGHLAVQNNKVMLDVSLIDARNIFGLNLNALNSDFSSTFFTYKSKLDNSYNATYSRTQIDNSFILKSDFDSSSTSLRSYVDNSYILVNTFASSFRDLRTLMDSSYIAKNWTGNPYSFDFSFDLFNTKVDLSNVLKSVFEASHNSLKSSFDISFASINASNINTSAITIEAINTKHDSQIFTNSLWNQLGQDFSSIPNNKVNNNKNVVISNDGTVVAYSLNDNLSIQQVEQAVQTWSIKQAETTVGTSNWISVCWSSELGIFVAVAYFGNNRVMTSPNGINWTARTVPAASTWYSVCWSRELRLFVAVAEGGTSTRAMTSPDGITWTARTAASETNRWSAVCWAAELGIFVAVSIDGTTRVMTSSNGIAWSSSNISGVEANIWIDVCWSNELGLFVAVSETGTNRVMTSPNGTTWTPRLAAGAQDNVWRSVCWSPELRLFVAVSDSGSNRVMISNNGINWISIFVAGTNSWYHVAWSKELELLIAVGTNCVMTSRNGIDWTSRTAAQSNNWLGLCWSPEQGIAVAVSDNGSNRVMTSFLPTTSRAGSVYVYELSYNNWSKLGNNTIIGLSGDELGYSLALSSNGRVVAASSLYKDASAGQVRVYELSNNTNNWIQKGSNINGPRPGSESGYSISLAGSGNSIAIGAWKDNSNGTNAGAVRVYDFSASISDWRQKGQTITGVSGSFEGYSSALSLDGQTLASGSGTIAGISSGGTLSISGGYIIHSFTTTGTSAFVPAFSGSVEVLIVGGGGGGGPSLGGGGGAGGVIYIPATNVISGISYEIVVGAGGPSGTKGGNSSVFGAIAAGGGTSTQFDTGPGISGGSGGGAAANQYIQYGRGIIHKGGDSSGNILGANNGIANVGTIYGCSGGSMTALRIAEPSRAAGGGGAGGPGLNTNPNTTGNTGQTGQGSGGVGVINTILGPSYYWGGGGGGSNTNGSGSNVNTGGWGGLGGGGGGASEGGQGIGGGSALNSGVTSGSGANTNGGAGGANTGGGGGGGAWTSGQGGAGGSGIVVIRYLQSVISSSIGRGEIKTFTISGNTWTSKGIIQGPQLYLIDVISYAYPLGPLFGRPFFDATYNNTVSTIDSNIALNSDGTILAQAMTQNHGYINVYKYRSVDASWIQLGERLTGSSQAGNVQYINPNSGEGMFISDDGYRISTGMNLDNGAQIYGARIYSYNGTSWNIIGDLSGIENGTNIIGSSKIHALSGDGNTIALQNDYTNYPNQPSNQMGQVRIYRYQGTGSSWPRLGNDISGTGTASLFMVALGSGLGISYDGNTIVASTRLYPRYTGMAGFQGIARVFKYSAATNTWNIIGEFLGPGTDVNTWKEFGFGSGGTQISGDGLTVAVTTQYAGIYIYKFINSSWQSALVGSTASGNIRLSYDGNTLLTNNQEIWKYTLNTWVRITTIPALVSNLRKLSLSRDGSTFGYSYVDTITAPINNGSVRVYKIETTKIINENLSYATNKDRYLNLSFGRDVKLSSNGNKIVIGATGPTNIEYVDPSSSYYRFNQGSIYTYEYAGSGTTWRQLGQTIHGISGGDEFGSSVSMSNDGTLISVGSNTNNYNRGQVRVFSYINNYWYQLSNSISGKTSNSRAGIHALSGDGRTLIQTNNTYNSVYGLNKSLSFTPFTTSNITTTISGGLMVGGKTYLNSLRISNRIILDVSGYSSNYLASTDISASIVDYYSNVGSTYNRVFRIDACGNITNYSGLYGAISDSRLKENIVNCTPKLEDLLKVRVVNYNLKGGDTSKYIGVVAQELEEIFPELVTETNTFERFKSVNYSNLTILLIKAFQEQQVLINNLNASLEELENEIIKHKT